MTTLRRLCGLAVLLTLSQLVLIRAPQDCAGHHETPAGSHTEMPMPGGDQAPCNHHSVPDACAAMASCVSTFVDVVSAAAAITPPSTHVVADVASTPTNATSSPDTPPPRV